MEQDCARLLLQLADHLDTLNDKLTSRKFRGYDDEEQGGEETNNQSSKEKLNSKEASSIGLRMSETLTKSMNGQDSSFEEDLGSVDLSLFDDKETATSFLQRMIDLTKDDLMASAVDLGTTLESDQVYIESLVKELAELKDKIQILEEESRKWTLSGGHEEFQKLKVELSEKSQAYEDLIAEFGVLEQQQTERERQTRALRILVEECKNEILDLRQERDQARAEMNAGFGMKERVTALEKQLLEEQQRYKSLREDFDEKMHELEEVKKELANRMVEIDALANHVLQLENELEEVSGRLETMTSQQAELEAEKDKVAKYAGHMADDLKEMQTKYDKLQDRLQRLGDVGVDPFEQLQNQIQDLKGERGELKARLAASIKKLRETEDSFAKEKSLYENDRKQLESALELLTKRLSELENIKEGLTNQYLGLQRNHAVIIEELKRLKEEKGALEIELQKIGDKGLAFKLRSAELYAARLNQRIEELLRQLRADGVTHIC